MNDTDGSQEVCCRPTIRADKPQILKVRFGNIGWTKVKAFALVNEYDFVEEIEQAFSSLVERHSGGNIGHVRQ